MTTPVDAQIGDVQEAAVGGDVRGVGMRRLLPLRVDARPLVQHLDRVAQIAPAAERHHHGAAARIAADEDRALLADPGSCGTAR